jgi:hypothetical protein
MSVVAWTEADTARALEIWAEYQRTHDVSDRVGQAVGIDPANGRVWFGADVVEIQLRREAAGETRMIYVLRVGCDYYHLKVGKQVP